MTFSLLFLGLLQMYLSNSHWFINTERVVPGPPLGFCSSPQIDGPRVSQLNCGQGTTTGKHAVDETKVYSKISIE